MTKDIKTLNLLIKNAAHPSRRDNSLLMRRIRRNKDFDLANSDLSFEELTKVLYNCKPGKYNLVNSDLNNDEQNNQAYKIKSIRKTSNLIVEETGLSPLAIGFPFFEGWLSDWYRGPLLLIPVEIKLNNSKNLNNWSVIIDENAEVSINLALLITLQQEIGMKFDPEAVPHWEVKDITESPDEFWNDIKTYFPDNIIANWDVLKNNVLEFPEISRDETPSKENYKGTFKLNSFAVLGHFPQGKNSLVNDLIKIKKLIDEDELPNTVKHILGNYKGDTFSEVLEEKVENIDDYSEEEILKILPADVTQEEVLLQSKTSRSLVVQGPPGTGKSQTIVNLIGDSLNENEKVLLVCEKRVALEVVYDMLKDLGLDFLSVIVGGSGSSKHESEKHVYNTLRQIAQTVKKTDNINLQKNNEKVDETIKKLNKVHSLLNQSVVDDSSSLTLEKLYKTTEQVSIDVLNKLDSFKEVQTSKELEKRLDKINNFLELKEEITNNSVWKNRKDGILADENIQNEDLMKKSKILTRSQKIAPLYKYLSKNNYQQLMDIENDFVSIDDYNLQMLSEMKDNSLRFLSLEWIKIRFKVLRDAHKISKEYSRIKKELESLKDLFEDHYINDYLIKLKNGESIKGFADSMYQDWESDKHFLERIDKMYSESDAEFAKDLQKLGEMSRNSKEAADLYERAVKTNWIKKKHQEHPELNYFMNNRYQELKEMLHGVCQESCRI